MAGPTVPLDEVQYVQPGVIDWWVREGLGAPMDENMIHRYFATWEDCFDYATKNGLTLLQSKNDWNLFQQTLNRQAFEDNIRKRPGTEYMIVGQPQPHPDPVLRAQGVTTGVYTIRKQDRQRARKDSPQIRPPHVLTEKSLDGREPWDLTVLGTYFVVGQAIYQAPSVFDVVGNRLLAAASSMNKFFEVANSLHRYSPATGYHYLARVSNRPTSTSASLPGSPSRSRESSLAPGTDSQSLRSASVQPESQSGGGSATISAQEAQLLAKSLEDAIRYGDDFMDENPLIGEPGSFRFEISNAAVKRRREDEAAAVKARLEKDSSSGLQTEASKVEEVLKSSNPPTVFSQDKTSKAEKAKDERRAGKASKKERRKSRAATSPTTPASATTPQASSAS